MPWGLQDYQSQIGYNPMASGGISSFPLFPQLYLTFIIIIFCTRDQTQDLALAKLSFPTSVAHTFFLNFSFSFMCSLILFLLLVRPAYGATTLEKNCGSMAQRLPSMQEALGPSLPYKKRKRKFTFIRAISRAHFFL